MKLGIVKIYTLWFLLIAALIAIYWKSGKYFEMMSLVIPQVEPAHVYEKLVWDNIKHNSMVWLGEAGLGFLVVFFAAAGQRWAQWLFLLFCVGQIFFTVSDVYSTSVRYPSITRELYENIITGTGLLLLVVLMVQTVMLMGRKD